LRSLRARRPVDEEPIDESLDMPPEDDMLLPPVEPLLL